MKKRLSILLVILTSVTFLSAQSPDAATVKHNDSLVLAGMITPRVNNGATTPDWNALAADVKAKYGESYVDRTVTKAKIYYYFGKDWPVFSKALVHYMETYEDKDNLRLMNKNAKMVLQYSQDPEEWKAADAWVKRAVDKEPGNAVYKETFDGLMTKIKGGFDRRAINTLKKYRFGIVLKAHQVVFMSAV